MEKAVKRFVSFQIKKGILEETQQELYEYAYRILLGRTIAVAVLFVIGIGLHTLFELILFSILFAALRQYAGGFHFSTMDRCIGFSSLVILMLGVILKNDFSCMGLLVLAVPEILSFLLIWFMSPVDCKNKRLDDLEKLVYRKRVRIVLLMEIGLLTFSLFLGFEKTSICVMSSHIVVAISLGMEFLNSYFFKTEVSIN